MKAISIRNIPDQTYLALKDLARSNHRSLQEQVRQLLEKEARLTTASSLVVAGEWRNRLSGRPLGNTVQDIRNDRQR